MKAVKAWAYFAALYPDGEPLVNSIAYGSDEAKAKAAYDMGVSWYSLESQGYRIVRVTITAEEANRE